MTEKLKGNPKIMPCLKSQPKPKPVCQRDTMVHDLDCNQEQIKSKEERAKVLEETKQFWIKQANKTFGKPSTKERQTMSQLLVQPLANNDYVDPWTYKVGKQILRENAVDRYFQRIQKGASTFSTEQGDCYKKMFLDQYKNIYTQFDEKTLSSLHSTAYNWPEKKYEKVKMEQYENEDYHKDTDPFYSSQYARDFSVKNLKCEELATQTITQNLMEKVNNNQYLVQKASPQKMQNTIYDLANEQQQVIEEQNQAVQPKSELQIQEQPNLNNLQQQPINQPKTSFTPIPSRTLSQPKAQRQPKPTTKKVPTKQYKPKKNKYNIDYMNEQREKKNILKLADKLNDSIKAKDEGQTQQVKSLEEQKLCQDLQEFMEQKQRREESSNVMLSSQAQALNDQANLNQKQVTKTQEAQAQKQYNPSNYCSEEIKPRYRNIYHDMEQDRRILKNQEDLKLVKEQNAQTIRNMNITQLKEFQNNYMMNPQNYLIYNQTWIKNIPYAGKKLEQEDNIKLVVLPEYSNECTHKLILK